MTLGNILYTLFIRPPRLLLETVFAYANSVLGHPGASVLFFALVLQLLLLPLHGRWDAVHTDEPAVPWRARKPAALLRKLLPMALELLIFAAVYSLLSGMTLLMGASIGPIRDLAQPDGLVTLFGVKVNALPLIMAVLYCVSAVLVRKEDSRAQALLRYGMALALCLLLYKAPSALTLCWLVGAVFRLAVKLIRRHKEPEKLLSVMAAVCGLLLIAVGAVCLHGIKLVFFVLVGLALLCPLLLGVLKKHGRLTLPAARKRAKPSGGLFLLEMLFLSLLAGLWIPSTVINASPLEFISSRSFYHPLWYTLSALCMAVGFFVVWLGAFYWLSSQRVKLVFERLAFIVCGVAIVDYLFFGRDLGLLSTALKYDNGLVFAKTELLINLAVVLALAALLWWVCLRWKDIARSVTLVCVLALVAMSAVNLFSIGVSVAGYKKTQSDEPGENTITLSREGENVIILMLDRAAGHLVPYILNERPELAEQFSGFVYYDNTITFGSCTNIATPALFGGYEYTPAEINKRADESLVSKQNEALKVMPVLFSEAGYDVTVYDPPWAGYQWIPDLSIYDDYPEIKTGITMGSYNGAYANEAASKRSGLERNFFCYSIMKMAPLCVQPTLYKEGNYRHLTDRSELTADRNGDFASYPTDSEQTERAEHQAYGICTSFLDSYTVLMHLKDETRVTDAKNGTFLMMSNDTTHEQNLLQAPDYTPSYMVDNTAYEQANAERFTVDGVTWDPEDYQGYAHYSVNVAAFLRLGEWFDYLKELGVYDNTRIILVSDHSDNRIGDMPPLEHKLDGLDKTLDMKKYYPLLMVKDFGASGTLMTDSTFMTNADVPTLATAGVIEKPTNPFTGKPIDNRAKQADKLYIFGSTEWETTVNDGNTFREADWYSVHDSIWDTDNWGYEGYGLYPKSMKP